MNYQNLVKGLLTEAKDAARYKQLKTPYQILTKIALAPVFLFKWAIVLSFYALLFMYNALLSPANYLETWQTDRSKDVRPATEAVIYLVTTPVIFFVRVMLSFVSFFFYFLWFDLMCFTYLFSLGSIRWQPFLNTASFDGTERHWKLKPSESGTMIFGIVAFSLLCVVLLLFVIFVAGDVVELYEVTMIFLGLYFACILVANPILFKKSEMTEEEYAAYQQQLAYAQQAYVGYDQQGYVQDQAYAYQSNQDNNYNA